MQEWEGIELKTVPYKDSGTCIIGGVDDVQAILDDQIVKVQAINASPFAAPFRERSSTHESSLMTLQVLLTVALCLCLLGR
jgi:dynein heavy chain, axonemal